MDCLPALELWDLIVSVLGNCSRVSDRSGKPVNGEHKHHKSQNKINVMQDIDLVPSNIQSARQEALLYVFECEHETTLFTPAFVDPASCHMHVSTSHSLQPALICAPVTDRDLDSCRWLKVSLKNDHQTFDRRETG